MLVEDDRRHTAQADSGFLVINGEAAGADAGQLLAQLAFRGDGARCQRARIPAGEDLLLHRLRREGEQGLADAGGVNVGAAAHAGDGPHHLLGLHLGEIDDLAAVENAEVDRLAGDGHQPPHDGAGDLNEIPGTDEGRAHLKGLHPDHPHRALVVEAHIALVLQGGEQAMGGGIGQAHLARQLRERQPLRMIGQGVEQLERARQGLHLSRRAQELLGRDAHVLPADAAGGEVVHVARHLVHQSSPVFPVASRGGMRPPRPVFLRCIPGEAGCMRSYLTTGTRREAKRDSGSLGPSAT